MLNISAPCNWANKVSGNGKGQTSEIVILLSWGSPWTIGWFYYAFREPFIDSLFHVIKMGQWQAEGSAGIRDL